MTGFWRGFMSVINLRGGERKNKINYKYRTKTDWEMIGDDFRKIINWEDYDGSN